MKKLIIVPALILIVSLLATDACNNKVEPGLVTGNETSIVTQGEDDALRRDAEVYAADQGVSVEEAIRRFELMDEAGPLQAAIAKNEATYAGSWIQHQPEYKFVFAFTRDGEETIKKYVKPDSPLAGLIEVRNLEVSYKELQKAHEETMKLLKELGLVFDSSINIKENQVEVYITDSELFYDILEGAGKNLPEHVVPIVIYEPLDETPPGVIPDPSIHFPQLKTRSGSFMAALMVGELTLDDGYLRVGDNLIIWQPNYFVSNNNGTIEILDRNGKVVGRVGEEIVMGGGSAGTIENVNHLLKEPLPVGTEGPFWLQGGGTRLSLNFSSDLFSLEVITSGEDKAYFLKRKPLLDEQARQEFTLTGKLVASYGGVLIKHPYIRVEAKSKENKGPVSYTTFWPADCKARIDKGGFEIMDGSGNVILRDGEEVNIVSKVIYGYSEQLNEELPGGYFGPYLVVDRILR